MILRRVIAHFRKQEWTAIAIDFVIVVLGVFVGLQVANWNAARSNERAYQDALRRLAEENRAMLERAASSRATISGMLVDAQRAIAALRNCEAGPEAEAIINKGLNSIRSGRAVGVSTLAIDQLVSDDRLLDRQDENARASLRSYHSYLHGVADTSFRILTDNDLDIVDRHPAVGFSGLVAPSETFNKADVRRAEIAVPPEAACKDPTFVKLFYDWERKHNFQLNLIGELEEIISQRAVELRLPSPAGLEKDAAP